MSCNNDLIRRVVDNLRNTISLQLLLELYGSFIKFLPELKEEISSNGRDLT